MLCFVIDVALVGYPTPSVGLLERWPRFKSGVGQSVDSYNANINCDIYTRVSSSLCIKLLHNNTWMTGFMKSWLLHQRQHTIINCFTIMLAGSCSVQVFCCPVLPICIGIHFFIWPAHVKTLTNKADLNCSLGRSWDGEVEHCLYNNDDLLILAHEISK